jgi:2-polyprenyl-3-methyl-5-hydroxy-6-metoxy-1,4-benzoquinol methylase
MEENYTYNPDQYWQDTEDSYPYYPTVRHRKRFILGTIKKYFPKGNFSAFDFGCGEGTLLKTIQDQYNLSSGQVGGCDISEQAIDGAKQKIGSPHLMHALYPTLEKKFDIMLCSEVLEHTTEYEAICRWMSGHLSPGGIMIVTTQTGRIHASDRYTGHTQHFCIKELCTLIEKIELTVVTAKLWGWPFFTLQKYLTNIRFDQIQENYLEGCLTLRKKIVFAVTYAVYCLHDLIPYGPQIYVVAKKKN